MVRFAMMLVALVSFVLTQSVNAQDCANGRCSLGSRIASHHQSMTYGAPVVSYGTPVSYGQVYGQPVYGSSVYSQSYPSYVQPSYSVAAYGQPVYSYGFSSTSGCANGRCGYSSSGRHGLFRRR